jgi:predicted DNA-binding transcriptional regulator AlpA
MNTDRIVRRSDLKELTGFEWRHVHNMEMRGDFPRRFKPDPNSKTVGWSLREIQDWIERRKAARAENA